MKTCNVDGCEKTATGRGMCNTHYAAWWRTNPDNKARQSESKRRSYQRLKASVPGFMERNRERYAKHMERPENREKHRERNRLRHAAGMSRRRGLTISDRHEYWLAQGGLCDMCKKPCADPALPDAWKVTVVDHDHGHCKSRIGCRDCVRGQGHRECNVAEGVVRKALTTGLLTAAWGPLSTYLADPPMGKWVRGRLLDGPSHLPEAA